MWRHIITAVNGVSAANKLSMGELLRNEVDKQVFLQVTTASGKKRDVVAVAIAPRRERDLRYLSWEKARAAQVEKVGEGRIGYVHLQAMGPNDIARWTREFYPVFQRDGLIIDLRHNGGGNIDSWIIEQLQRRAWHFWQSRRSDQITANQQVTFRGHVVALIDANTYSDGETLAQGLRRLHHIAQRRLGLRRPKGIQHGKQLSVLRGEHGHGKQGCIGSPRTANGKCGNRHALGHLHDRVQGV